MADRSSKKKTPHDTPDEDDAVPEGEDGIRRDEKQEIEERLRLRAAVVYEIIRVEGEGELARSFSALW